VILATGYYDVPNLLNCPGEELPKVVHYYKEPHPYYDQDVLIVGAKNSAVIAALELWWSGARVTMVHRGEEIHKNVKYWLKPNIENRIRNGEIPMHWRSQILEIRPESVLLATPDGVKEIPNHWVFAMTGYQPDTAFLEAHGIRFDPETKRPRTDPETLESDRKGMYLAGVIVAGMHTHEIFIENGRFHGKQIAAAIASLLQ
jgi:thioredoxin reductase (NADPH)